MRQVSAKAWVGGTVVLSVLLLVAAWFLMIDPVVARASEDSVAADSQRQQNDLLVQEIAKLKEQATHLDEFKAELAVLRAEMPVDTDPSGLTRELNDLASAAGVTITALQPSVAEAFVPAVAADASAATTDAGAATEGTEPEASADGSTDTAAAAPAAQLPAAIEGFYQIPIAITSIGSYEGSVAFLQSLQEGASRLYLVSSIAATTQEDQGAESGRPATVKGDIELSITGYAFVLLDPALVAPDDSGATLPVPDGQVNPFQPGR